MLPDLTIAYFQRLRAGRTAILLLVRKIILKILFLTLFPTLLMFNHGHAKLRAYGGEKSEMVGSRPSTNHLKND